MFCTSTRFLIAVAAVVVSACSGGSSKSTVPGDAGPGEADVPVETPTGPEVGSLGGAETGPGAETGQAGGLTGIVTDKLGVPVVGAKIESAGASVFSDAQGKFTLKHLTPGPTTVKVSQVWFAPTEQSVTLLEGAGTPWDVVLEEMPLKVDPADRALADSYNQTFDWTKQTVSIAIVETPTRCAFDNAIYFHNPTLFRNTSTLAQVTPSPLPDINAGVAANFTFPVGSGANKGQEALDLTTLVDSIKDTPLGPTEPTNYMIWTSMVKWLIEWDPTKATTVNVAGVAVSGQGWGSNVIRPQTIEKVFLDPNTGKLWVKVVFENFVQLGSGINDDDGDGRKEIYAALGSTHYTAEIVNALANTYAKVTFTTHGLSKEVSKSLNELYSSTGATVERYIGQPFDLTGLGTIAYPFVVLRHTAGQKNVILVAPAP
jgi:hypothetical protein